MSRIQNNATKSVDDFKDDAHQSVDDAHGLMQMYQAGFLDGYNSGQEHEVKFKKIQDICKKAFEFRFGSELQRRLKIRKEINQAEKVLKKYREGKPYLKDLAKLNKMRKQGVKNG